MSKNNISNLICRTCLSVQLSEQHFSIDENAHTQNFENLLIRDMIEKCVPEMDLEICGLPVICKSCYELLIHAYSFKSKCYQAEERIYMYLEENNLQLGDKIDLYDVAKEGYQSNDDQAQNEENSIFKIHIKEEVLPVNDSDSKEFEIQDAASDEVERTKLLYPKRPYSCNKCEYKGFRQDLLKKHLKTCKLQKEVTKKFKCDRCSYMTARKRALIRHNMTHGGERPYVCGICEKGYTEKNQIKIHMFKHLDIPLPYKCEEGDCKASFGRKSDMNTHILKHVDYNPYECDICHKAYPSVEQINRHMKRVHKKYTS